MSGAESGFGSSCPDSKAEAGASVTNISTELNYACAGKLSGPGGAAWLIDRVYNLLLRITYIQVLERGKGKSDNPILSFRPSVKGL